ncbi:MAG: hypothetical protein LBK58_13485 [Prevotellaceae bacterium]|jgi:hypothetical protein|nr:hypothetical protein [Prevotellaceae bacterium]
MTVKLSHSISYQENKRNLTDKILCLQPVAGDVCETQLQVNCAGLMNILNLHKDENHNYWNGQYRQRYCFGFG